MNTNGKPDGAGSENSPVVAIAHDYLTQRGGAERVVLAMLRIFPDAVIYTTLYDPEGTFPEFKDAKIVTSPLNRVPFLRRNHRLALPFLPFASAWIKVMADVVLTSSTGWAHAFQTSGKRIVYCHTPARWLYLTDEYLGRSAFKSAAGWFVLIGRPFLRRWDHRAAMRAHRYVGNSTVIQRRIRDVYGLNVPIIHPPHSVDTTGERTPIPGIAAFVGSGGHFLLVSRLLPYKNVDQAIEAFRGTNERLVIIGAGPMADKLQAMAPSNVNFASHVTDAQMRWAYASCKAVLAPSFEDFGITPLEGGAWGKPIVALRAGGYLDTVVEGLTGIFFEQPTPSDIRETISTVDSIAWDSGAIEAHAASFSEEIFKAKILREVELL